MKILPAVYIVAIASILQSCGGAVKNADKVNAANNSAATQATIQPKGNSNLFVNDEKDLIGNWVGSFNIVNDPDSSEEVYWADDHNINIAIYRNFLQVHS